MYCKECGKEVKGDYCTACGFQVGNGQGHCQHCGNEMVKGADVCLKCGKLVKEVNRMKQDANICSNCQTVVFENSLFCQKCGSKIEEQKLKCKFCGSEISKDSDVCINCGKLLVTVAPKSKDSGCHCNHHQDNSLENESEQLFGKVSTKTTRELKWIAKLLTIIGGSLLLISIIAKIVSSVIANTISKAIQEREYYDYDDLINGEATIRNIVNLLDNVIFKLIFLFGILILGASVILFTLSHKNKNKIVNYLRYSIIPSFIGLTLLFVILTTFIGNNTLFTVLMVFTILTSLLILGDIIFRFITIDKNIAKLVFNSITIVFILVVAIIYIIYLIDTNKYLNIINENLGYRVSYSSLYGFENILIASMDFDKASMSEFDLRQIKQLGFNLHTAIIVMAYYIQAALVTVLVTLSGLLFSNSKKS